MSGLLRRVFGLAPQPGREGAPAAADPGTASSAASGADETDLRMMRRALELADEAASLGEVPVGAVVYRPGAGPGGVEVLGEGYNTRERDADPSAHAEFVAMVRACRALGDWRLEGCSLAVTLEPCPMCAGLIVNARLPRVVYGADDPKAGAVRSLMSITGDPRLNHRAAVIPGVLAEQSADRLRSFFKTLRARKG